MASQNPLQATDDINLDAIHYLLKTVIPDVLKTFSRNTTDHLPKSYQDFRDWLIKNADQFKDGNFVVQLEDAIRKLVHEKSTCINEDKTIKKGKAAISFALFRKIPSTKNDMFRVMNLLIMVFSDTSIEQKISRIQKILLSNSLLSFQILTSLTKYFNLSPEEINTHAKYASTLDAEKGADGDGPDFRTPSMQKEGKIALVLARLSNTLTECEKKEKEIHIQSLEHLQGDDNAIPLQPLRNRK